MNLSHIQFTKITEGHIQKIYEWRNKPHMSFWDKDGISLEEVEKKYSGRISGKDNCKCYIVSIHGDDFGLIQYYENNTEPEYAKEIGVTDGVSIDLFIGEEKYIGKGLGKKMLNEFTDKILVDNKDVDTIYICHEIENKSAIHCSLSSGFVYLKDVVEDGKESKLFVKERNKNAEFRNEKLAQIYESFNQFSQDENFWLKTIKDLGVKDITDFGCGTGLFTGKLGQLGYSMRGIEPAFPMIQQAKQKDGDNKVVYIHGGYEQLHGFSTDLVLMTSHVSQFIVNGDEWNTLLSNAYRVLNTGGYILFDSKNPLLEPWKNYTRENYNRTKDTKFGPVNMQIEVSQVKGNIITHDIHYTFLDTQEEFTSSNTLIYKTKQEIEQDLVGAGFKVVKVYGDWKGEQYTDTNSEMIFLAQKV